MLGQGDFLTKTGAGAGSCQLHYCGIALLLTSRRQPSVYGRSRPAYPITARRFLKAWLAGRALKSADEAAIAAVCSVNEIGV